jgi:Mrp family chromosome partitioning ATPase
LVALGDPCLKLLTAGDPLPRDPLDALQGERLGELIAQLRERADFIIFDAPPSLELADALILALNGLPVLQVVEAGRATCADTSSVIDAVAVAGCKHLGLVLNKVRHTPATRTYDYHYYSFPPSHEEVHDQAPARQFQSTSVDQHALTASSLPGSNGHQAF